MQTAGTGCSKHMNTVVFSWIDFRLISIRQATLNKERSVH